VVDLDTLQAVITNRYDVLSRYTQSLKQVYREEIGKRQDRRRFKGLKPWLAEHVGDVPAGIARAALELLRGESRALHTLYAMRQELVAVWERSNASREHLLKALQDWCERAENSGVRQLQELSMRLRSYVPA
jgi:stearoyl-CoA desaturase (delta-9 desaturase)